MSRLKLSAFIIFIFSSSCERISQQTTTFILVRHAEKGNDGTQDPDLTDEGRMRAQNLLFMLKDTPLTAIYATNYKRTRHTVQPISAFQNVEILPYEAFKPDVIESMVEKHRGGTVLISGHSNTIPWTANLLVGAENYKDYAESEYGIVLIIAVADIGKPGSVLRVNY